MAMATTDGGKSKAKYTGPDAARKAASAPKKTAAPAKIKVGQDVIDFIKSQGMTATLKRVGSMSPAERSRDAEYAEGVRRMYGDRRFQDATRTSNPAASTAPKYKSADAARAGKSTTKTSPRKFN